MRASIDQIIVYGSKGGQELGANRGKSLYWHKADQDHHAGVEEDLGKSKENNWDYKSFIFEEIT